MIRDVVRTDHLENPLCSEHMSCVCPSCGLQFSYSNLAYSLLGRLLVEEKFFPEMKYEEYVQQNILNPLGMKRTGFNFTKRYISYFCVHMAYMYMFSVDQRYCMQHLSISNYLPVPLFI